MVDRNDDFNNLMFDLDDHRPDQQEENELMRDSSDIGSSLSNFGIDIHNVEENLRYIQENQYLQAVVQGVGIPSIKSDDSLKESGLGTSISKTRYSEFTPEIIDYSGDNISVIDPELNEPEPGPSRVKISDNGRECNETKVVLDEQELEVSSFDLALQKGYFEQAKIKYDDASSKGKAIETKFSKKLSQLTNRDQQEEIAKKLGYSELEEPYWSKSLCLHKCFMLKQDFKQYLDCIHKCKYRKVTNKINCKLVINEKEKQILKNIKTKDRRSNPKLINETIQIILDYIKTVEQIEEAIKNNGRGD